MMKTENQAQQLYTEKASFYERVFVNFLGWGKEVESFFQKTNYLQSGMKILDAGCGTGIITRTLHQLAIKNNYHRITFHAFDLTQNMLAIFQQWITKQKANDIELRQADVLQIETLPSSWRNYDLIVSSAMLEYLPKNKVAQALANLKSLLRTEGILLVIMTKRNLLTWLFAKKLWKANIYKENEIQPLFHEAGFEKVAFKVFSSNSWWPKSIMVIEAKSNLIQP